MSVKRSLQTFLMFEEINLKVQILKSQMNIVLAINFSKHIFKQFI